MTSKRNELKKEVIGFGIAVLLCIGIGVTTAIVPMDPVRNAMIALLHKLFVKDFVKDVVFIIVVVLGLWLIAHVGYAETHNNK